MLKRFKISCSIHKFEVSDSKHYQVSELCQIELCDIAITYRKIIF